jgi:uncharacterized FlaG/YvyC family protein
MTTTSETTLPEILTANTFYWRPGSSASSRHSNEQRHTEAVQRFLDAHTEAIAAAGLSIEFSYSESCNNVYKRLEIYQNGTKKDIRALKKALGIK